LWHLDGVLSMDLICAEENHPLYIVEIEDKRLKHWLSRAGIEIGDPVWKLSNIGNVGPVWVEGQWGQVVVGVKYSSELMVEKSTGKICTLDLLPEGDEGRITHYKNRNSYELFQEASNLKRGTFLHVKRKFNRLNFHVKFANETTHVNDEIAFNIWGEMGGTWVQLGAICVGQPFFPRYSSAEGEARAFFEHLKREGNSCVTIKEIVSNEKDEHGTVPCLIKSKSRNILTVETVAAEKIKVRPCDICWSCGVCN
jgi:hypothetical protein